METITPIPDSPAKPMEDEISDILGRLREQYPEESVESAVDGMEDPAKFNLVQALHELEKNIATS